LSVTNTDDSHAYCDAHARLADPTVDELEGLSGVHAGNRRVHSKGIVCRAVFKPSGAAARMSTAPHLREAGSEIEAVVRFSGSSSDPDLADLLSPGKGLAVQFRSPGDTSSVLTAATIPVFFAKTPESFLDLLREVNRLKRGGIGAILAAKELSEHFPEFKSSMAHLKKLRPPASYACCRYYAIHAFLLVDEAGRRRPVKFEWMPELGVDTLSLSEMRALPADYLELELAGRMQAGPVRFGLHIVLGQEGDPTDDPTQPWPNDRERIVAGTLILTGLAEDAEGLLMDPTETGPGIEPSDDPILRFRSPVYAESWRRRSEEM